MSKIKALLGKVKYLLTHPTVVVGIVQAGISGAIAQGLFTLSPIQTGEVMAVVSAVTGLIAAALTQGPLITWLISLGQAAVGFFAGFSLGFDTQRTAAIIGLGVLLLSYVQHSKTSPKYGPLAKARQQAALEPTAPTLVHVVNQALIDHEPPANSANSPVPISVSGDPSPYEGAMKAAKKAKATKAKKVAKPSELS